MYTLPTLPYAYNALEPYIDERTMHIHHEKHHAAYIKNVNDALAGNDGLLALPVETLITKLSDVPEPIRMKVRNNAGGHANHSLFWTVMGPAVSGAKPIGNVATGIDAAFGSFAAFTEKFAAAALARFGSGWVWLVARDGALSLLDTPNQDNPLMDNKGTPILGLDVWEHAYYLKYQNMRADYVTAWWNVINWNEVEKRLSQV